MVRGKKPLRSGVPKSVSSRVDCKCGTHLHLPVGHVVRATRIYRKLRWLMRGTSSAGASDSGIDRCWGGGTSDLERLSSSAGRGGALLQEVESRQFRERWLRKRSAEVASMLQSYRLEAAAL
jgi:hypothetical protein